MKVVYRNFANFSAL